MTNLFDPATAASIKTRVEQLRADAQPQWGRMNPAQALAHLTLGVRAAHGELRPPRMLMGILLGPVIKRLALGNEAPMRRNSPTVPAQVVADERVFDVERRELIAAIDRFVQGGPAACTTHPHAFFGRLTPDQWAELMYKHLDHHLRQYGA